jgi:DNA-binding HxlR family transcriptional regulator
MMGKAHVNELLREFALGPDPWRFGQLQEQLDLSPNTLSSRLDDLRGAGLIERKSYDEVPPRVEYEATPKLRELKPMYEFLEEWIEDST